MNGIGTTLTLLAGAAIALAAVWRPVREFFTGLASGTEAAYPKSPLKLSSPGHRVDEPSPGIRRASRGDAVRIHYTGWLSDNRIFDTSHGEEPLEFSLGAGHHIPGLEQAVEGMAVGETKLARVAPADAYGPKVPEYMVEISRDRLPRNDVQVGDLIEIPGSPIPARIAEFRGDMVLMDANHPLAGEELTFEITLLDVIPSGSTQAKGDPHEG